MLNTLKKKHVYFMILNLNRIYKKIDLFNFKCQYNKMKLIVDSRVR